MALIAKKIEPKVSLGWYFGAALWLDLVWAVFLWLGIENLDIDPALQGVWPVKMDDIAMSHSVMMVIIWAVIVGCTFFYRRKRSIAAWLMGGLVMGHWGLDYLFHRADLALFPWSPGHLGWGIWDSLTMTVAIHFGVFGLGILMYIWAVKSDYLKVKSQFWLMMIVIAGVGLGSLITTPQDQGDVMNAGFLLWTLIPIGFWIDHKRPETYQAIR